MDAKKIETLLDYHYGVFEAVWVCVNRLNARQFVAESDYSLGSVRNHLVHCMNVDDRWIARLKGLAPPARLAPADFPDQAAARLKWERIQEGVLQSARSMTDVALNESIWVELPDRFPEARRFNRWEILLHIVNHGTDHRAQILLRLHQLSANTFEQDFILHLWREWNR